MEEFVGQYRRREKCFRAAMPGALIVIRSPKPGRDGCQARGEENSLAAITYYIIEGLRKSWCCLCLCHTWAAISESLTVTINARANGAEMQAPSSLVLRPTCKHIRLSLQLAAGIIPANTESILLPVTFRRHNLTAWNCLLLLLSRH